MTTLGELIDSLGTLDSGLTIYAEQPWTPGSRAAVAPGQPDGRLLDAMRAMRLAYFLEVSIAREVCEDWVAVQRRSPDEIRARVIHYAINDA